MIIIADTTPLHYLILIGEADVLEKMFGPVIVPQAVIDELRRAEAPQPVRQWINLPPWWLDIKEPSLELIDAAKSLGKGERAAIALAVELAADALLLDDKRAKNEARRRNIPVIPLLNILEGAAVRNWLDLPETINRLWQTNFYLPAQELIEEALERDRQRKKGKS